MGTRQSVALSCHGSLFSTQSLDAPFAAWYSLEKPY
jgi:hypothetical protein